MDKQDAEMIFDQLETLLEQADNDSKLELAIIHCDLVVNGWNVWLEDTNGEGIQKTVITRKNDSQ
jgi:hypothetical protein